MNKNIQSVFQKLLVDNGLDQPVPLGGKAKTLSNEERELLMLSLAKAAKWNGFIAVIIMAIQGILLVFCLVVVWYLKDNPSSFQIIVGGSLIGLVPLATMFSKVWKEKHRMDILRAVLPLIALDKLTDLAFFFAKNENYLNTP
jgi:hypothetical protein